MNEIVGLLLGVYIAVGVLLAAFGPFRYDIDRHIAQRKPSTSSAKIMLFRLVTSSAAAIAWPFFLPSLLSRKPDLLDVISDLADEPVWIGDFDRTKDRLLSLWDTESFALELEVDNLEVRRKRTEPEPPEWTFGFSSAFRKAVANIDKKLQGRILEALTAISRTPIEPRGDTQKPLSGKHAGLWRYRVGDYRLIYHPEPGPRRVLLVDFGPRGSVYD